MLPALPTSVLPWWRGLVGAAVAAPLCFLVGQCDGRRTERTAGAAATDHANVEVLQRDANATATAADERGADNAAVAASQGNLTNAIAPVPDTAPDAVRVRLGCERLRHQGTDISAIPACR